VFGLLYPVVVGLSLHRGASTGIQEIALRAPISPTRGFLDSSGIVHNLAMSLGPVEIFFILVVVGLVVYVLWRLLIRPRR
jgi:hypothetical protein